MRTTFAFKELLGTVSVDFKQEPGVLLKQDLSPSLMVGTKLAHESSLWSQYRFRKCKFTVIASCPTTVGGTYAHAVDYDVDNENYLDEADYIQRLQGATSTAIWDTNTMAANCNKNMRSQNYYKVDYDENNPEDTVQAVYMLALTTPINGLTQGVIGLSIWVDYDVEFSGSRSKPELEAPPSFELKAGDHCYLDDSVDAWNEGLFQYTETQGDPKDFRPPELPMDWIWAIEPAEACDPVLADQHARYAVSYDGFTKFYESYAIAVAGGNSDLRVKSSEYWQLLRPMALIPLKKVDVKSFRGRAGYTANQRFGRTSGKRPNRQRNSGGPRTQTDSGDQRQRREIEPAVKGDSRRTSSGDEIVEIDPHALELEKLRRAIAELSVKLGGGD